MAASSNPNISNAVRDLWTRQVVPQVLMKNPLFTRFLLANRVTWNGGDQITKVLRKKNLGHTGSSYTPQTPLPTERESIYAKMSLQRKYWQLPIVYDVEEKLASVGGNSVSTGTDVVSGIVEAAQQGARDQLYALMYETSVPRPDTATAGTPAASTDTGAAMQGIRQPLTHDSTYGGITRADSTTNPWYQGASISGAWTDQSTNYGQTLDMVEQCRDAITLYNNVPPSELFGLCGFAIYKELKAQVLSKYGHASQANGIMGKYGFESIMVHGVEIVQDTWLRDRTVTGAHQWFFMLTPKTWELRFSTGRQMKMLPFQHQANITDGADQWLSRIMSAGNLACYQPNANIYLDTIS